MTEHEMVTLASVIERETGKADERALISGVFHNRLRIGMRLQSDPTVLYSVGRTSGRLRRADLQNPSPYNTYVHGGLPPGADRQSGDVPLCRRPLRPRRQRRSTSSRATMGHTSSPAPWPSTIEPSIAISDEE